MGPAESSVGRIRTWALEEEHGRLVGESGAEGRALSLAGWLAGWLGWRSPGGQLGSLLNPLDNREYFGVCSHICEMYVEERSCRFWGLWLGWTHNMFSSHLEFIQ